MYTFNKPSTDFIMHRYAFFVITVLNGFFDVHQILKRQHGLRRQEDDRGRLARIVAKTCAACGYLKVPWN